MSSTWYAAFTLLTILVLLNSVVLVATMRQVGVLHLRVRPVGHGQIEGPGVGQHLRTLPFNEVPGVPCLVAKAPILILAYVTPGCDACDLLLPVLHGFDRSKPHDLLDIALVTDATIDDAQFYAEKHAVKLPMLRHDDLAAHFAIPGSPYVLALRRSESGKLVVLAGGVVNTMEQLEDLVDSAQDNVRALAAQGLGPSVDALDGTQRKAGRTPMQESPKEDSNGRTVVN